MHKPLAWDELRFVLAVGRAGSLSKAARRLGVNHSTVFRRIASIEEQLGVRLFERHRDGYRPTPAGESMVRVAEAMDEEVVALERRLSGEDLRPSGTVRVTTTDTLIDLLVPLCGAFRRDYPEIAVELITGSDFLSLSRRDADVALRPSRQPPENLYGRRIASIAFALFAADSYLVAAGGGDLAGPHWWIGLDDSLSHLAAYGWLQENVAPERTMFRASSFLAVLRAAAAGLGIALLPCYVAAREPALQQISPPLEAVAADLWLLVHDDLRRTARIRALIDFLYPQLVELRPLFEGESGLRRG